MTPRRGALARAQGVIVTPDPMFLAPRARIISLAARARVPAIYNQREFVEAGGLMSYGASIRDAYARAAVFADRMLRGANPGELPVAQPASFVLALNIATARSLGIAVPQALLLRADEVIP
jgi:putative ABC transport system substrate-binding protein